MKRYRLMASFIEEQRVGFQVHHTIDVEIDSHNELNEKLESFTMSYNHNYCHSMKLQLIENQTKLTELKHDA